MIYSFIALILGMAHASNGRGSVGGNPGTSAADKTFEILNALGSIAFAYNFALILPEIQSTLKQPPSAVRTMTRVSVIAITASYVFYIWVGVAGYAALGSNVTPIILNSFCGPNWAILLAQIAILIHMLSAFQVFGQALFNTIESHIKYYLVQRGHRQARLESGSIHPATIEEGDEVDEVDEVDEDTKDSATRPPYSPFDAANSSGLVDPRKKHIFGFDHIKLDPIEERLSSVLSSQVIELTGSAPLGTSNSTLKQRHTAPASIIQDTYSRTHEAPHIGKKKGRLSMFSADTGFANEEVLLNEEGSLVPFRFRLVARSVVVGVITVLAAVMPFFGCAILVPSTSVFSTFSLSSHASHLARSQRLHRTCRRRHLVSTHDLFSLRVLPEGLSRHAGSWAIPRGHLGVHLPRCAGGDDRVRPEHHHWLLHLLHIWYVRLSAHRVLAGHVSFLG